MKHISIFSILLLAIFIMVSCVNKEEEPLKLIKQQAQEALQKNLHNGDAMQINSINVVKDSIPYILDLSLEQLFRDAKEAQINFEQARDSHAYSMEQTYILLKKFVDASTILDETRDSLKRATKDYGYIALIDFTGKNKNGVELTSKALVIFTDTLELKPSGVIVLDENRTQMLYDMLSVDENIKMSHNKFGMIQTDSLDRVLTFILDGHQIK